MTRPRLCLPVALLIALSALTSLPPALPAAAAAPVDAGPMEGLLQERPRRVQRAVGARTAERVEQGDVPYVMPGDAPAVRTGARRAVQRGTVQRAETPGVRARRAPARAMRTTTRYDLPYRGDDLAAGERIFVGKEIHSASGSQMWGYDIGAMRVRDGDAWAEVKPDTRWSDLKNTDYYIYDQPVYAMGPGTIIRCWRNAPENPRPFSSAMGDSWDDDFEDRAWLHPSWRDKRMSGGGNHLLVEEDDGDLMLYAHARPGTIPSDLCPHDAALYSKADANEEADVPEAQQRRIEAGQYLFRTGNSGNSSAPHLHVHLQTADGDPIQMQFRRGLSTPVSGNTADIDDWTRFAGERIPDGPVLVWPPRSLGPEYTRHGYPAASYQRLFDHLADSGFWPEWIDGYSVGGSPFLNVVWRPAQDGWRAYHLVSGARYQEVFEEAVAAGYAPVHVESSLVGGAVRYSVIFAKNRPGAVIARHGLTYDQHMSVMDEAKAKGLYPVNVSVVSPGGSPRYTVLYRPENIGRWQVKSRVRASDYQALYQQNHAAGRHPAYVNAYMHDGDAYFSVIFAERPGGSRKDRHGLTAGQFQQEFESAHQSGLLTRAVSGYDGASKNHRFIAYWRQ